MNLFRYYRCKVVQEQRATVDVRLLDIGGTERVERSSLILLPEELKNQPEFGFQCSLRQNVSVTDTRLRETEYPDLDQNSLQTILAKRYVGRLESWSNFN